MQVDGLAGQNPALSIGLILCGIQGFSIRSDAAAGGNGCSHAEAVERIKAARRPLTLTFARSAAARSGADIGHAVPLFRVWDCCVPVPSLQVECHHSVLEAQCLLLLFHGLNRV